MTQLDESERWLRADLETAHEEFLKATPDSWPTASKRFRQALDSFAALILREKVIERAYDNVGAYGTRRTAA